MNMRTPTKQKLLNVLKREHESSIKDIMVHFDISEIAVRKHLRELISQGFIEEQSVKQEIGRPFHLYTLTSKGHATFPNQHEQLPLELLQDLEDLKGRKAVNDLLLRRKKREEAELLTELADKSFDKKVHHIMQHQTKKGYMIEYEKTAEGDYTIKNFNCPIYNLASSYAQICRHEMEMYQHIFDNGLVDSDACLTKGDTCCSWMIKQRKEEI